MKLPADRPILFLKAHVRGYVRRDGAYVKPHDDKRQSSLFDDSGTANRQASGSAAGEPKPESSKVPDVVLSNLASSLEQLREIRRGVDGAIKNLDDKMSGGGRYEADALENRANDIKAALEVIAEFKGHAPQNSVDADKVLAELGGVPDFTPSARAAEWMNRRSDRRDQSGHGAVNRGKEYEPWSRPLDKFMGDFSVEKDPVSPRAPWVARHKETGALGAFTQKPVSDSSGNLITPAGGAKWFAKRDEVKNALRDAHKKHVEAALAAGRSVPPDVLVDYTDMVRPSQLAKSLIFVRSAKEVG